ncbi:copper resistance CopC/CopD family protein [Priestia megaterium]|uniref:copper resistance CopC/CopD family protein n=1 Tax=Priestia megaterium TaxID=1404 RepID=UPI00244B4695|nr:copper resistance protein CopC [Priestia megaterium]MDH2363852.1 copper resistance protein CopC [Priestia megaterium]
MLKKIVLLLSISFFVLGAPLNVSAHAVLLDASPKEGSQLKQMPDKVSLTFNERLGEGVFNLQVRNDKGKLITTKKATMNRSHKTISLDVPPSKKGIYTVSYSVISADSHPVQGTYIFSIGEKIDQAITNDTSNQGENGKQSSFYNIGFSLVQTFYYLALLWLVGFVLWKWYVPYQTGQQKQKYNTNVKYLQIGYMIFLLISIGVQGTALLKDSSLSQIQTFVIHSATGWSWMICIILACVGFLFLLKNKWIDFIWAGLLLVATTLNGHAVASDVPIYTMILDFIHLVTASLWAAGLAYLLMIWRKEREQALAFLPIFSRIAFVSLMLLILSGVLYTLKLLPDITALFKTTWGLLLLAKIFMVMLVAGIGILIREHLRKNDSPSLAKFLISDISFMLIIVLIVGTITHLNPVPHNDPLVWKENKQDIEFLVKTSTLSPGKDSLWVTASLPQDGSSIQSIDIVLSPKNKGELAPIDVPLKESKEENRKKQQLQYKMYETNNLVIPYAGRWQIAVRLVTSNLDEVVIYKDIVVYDVK